MKLLWIAGSFGAMYLIATVIGFGTYLLISPVAMWISVFTFMPVVSAWLIYRYLQKMKFTPKASLAECVNLLLVWIGLSYGLDALTYILIVPAIKHTPPNWTFFQDQSPWIWLSYAVLLLSGYLGHWAYLKSLNA